MASNKLIKGASQRFNRQNIQTVHFARDFDSLIDQYDSLKIIGQSRALYHNNPLVKSAIEKKSAYSIGNAFEYRSLSKDSEVKLILDAAIAQWSKIAEVSGKTFNDVLYLSSVSLDVDGDVFILFSETKSGYPVCQLIEAHAIGSRTSGKIDLGNLYEEKGVQYDKKTKRPINYRILGTDETKDVIVSVKDMMRISEPSFSQRGTPLVASCLQLLQDLEHSQELLLTQHLMAASRSMIEHNESGTNEYNLGDETTTDVNIETIGQEGGEIVFFKSGTGGKLEMLENPNPPMHWQEYQNTLTNMCLLALDWSKNLCGMSTGTGVNDRLEIQQCQKTCSDRQVLLAPFASRICNWVISKLIKGGFINLKFEDLPEDWFNNYFTKCRFISVDLSRDSKSILEELKYGVKNLGQVLAEDGIEYNAHVLDRFREEAIRIKLKEQVEKEFGVTIDDNVTRLISPTQFQATTEPTL